MRRSQEFYRSDVDCAADGMASRLVDDFGEAHQTGRVDELSAAISRAVDEWFGESPQDIYDAAMASDMSEAEAQELAWPRATSRAEGE